MTKRKRSKKAKLLSSCESGCFARIPVLINRASIFTKDYKADAAAGKGWKEGEP